VWRAVRPSPDHIRRITPDGRGRAARGGARQIGTEAAAVSATTGRVLGIQHGSIASPARRARARTDATSEAAAHRAPTHSLDVRTA